MIICITTCQPAIAKDFGKQANSWVIAEEGLITMIKRKLAALNLSQVNEQMQALARKRIEQPLPINNISKAKETISWSFDPSYLLEEDVYLPCGKLLYAAGTKINPLDHMEWHDRLIFIDGRDQQQLTWLKKQYINQGNIMRLEAVAHLKNAAYIPEAEHNSSENKIVLIAGKPLDIEQQIEQRIYFDQFGSLTSKFNISHVPALVEQDGKYLKITEIAINGN